MISLSLPLSFTHTHSHARSPSLSRCLWMPLSPLSASRAGDQPLADRTGPLASCYRPPLRTDWKALIAASPQARENHRISVIGSFCSRKKQNRKEWGEGKGRLDTSRELKRENTAEGEWQTAPSRETVFRERRAARGSRASLRLRAVYRGRRRRTSGSSAWAFAKPKALVALFVTDKNPIERRKMSAGLQATRLAARAGSSQM